MKRSEGLGKIILEGKIDGKSERRRPRRWWKRDIRYAFNMSLTVGGRLATDRSCFTCAVRNVTSYGDKQLEKKYMLTNGGLLIKLAYMSGLAWELLKILQSSTCYGT